MIENPKFRRVLLKISGEAFQGEKEYGINPVIIENIAEEIRTIHSLGVEVGVVVGGGNIFRGGSAIAWGIDKTSADYMGMLATVINALALQDALEKTEVFTRIMSAIEMREVAEPFIIRRAIRHLEKGRVVIFAAGTGNPHFTTDTAASLRALEIQAEVILKGTKVDGVYDLDPVLNKDAKKFLELTYIDLLQRGIKVMDSTAISMCMDNDIPIIVFDITKKGNVKRVIMGENVGTVVWRGYDGKGNI